MGTILGAAVRLFLLCLAVGLAMAFFHVTPAHLVGDLAGGAMRIWALTVSFVRWALPYALLGAYIVVPAAAIVLVLRAVRR